MTKVSGFPKLKVSTLLVAGLTISIVIFASYTTAKAQTLPSCAALGNALGTAYVTVNADQQQVNVRNGPNSYQYGKIGILLIFESAPALGRSIGGDWIQISCPNVPGGTGWVYAANVTLTAKSGLPVIDIPATITPQMTSTVDPQLAAEFPVVEATFTRLPTYTPPGQYSSPFYSDNTVVSIKNKFGEIIIAGFIIGIMILLISFFIKH